MLARIHAIRLESEAEGLAGQSRDAAAAFAISFEGGQRDTELRLLDERHARSLSASRWGLAGMAALSLAVILVVAAWVAHELRIFAEQAGDIERTHPGDGPPKPPAAG
jgi:hypothetical protein